MWVRLILVQQIANIAWMSFDLQEYKIHDNVSLVVEHLTKLFEWGMNRHFFVLG